MQGHRSVFATHRGSRIKRIVTWVAAVAIGFAIFNALFSGVTAPEDAMVGTSASSYGVEEIGVADADDSAKLQAEARKEVLSSEDKQDKLVIAGYPANPFNGSAPVAYGPSDENGRLSIDVGSSSGGTDSGNGDATESTSTDGASESSGASAPSSAAGASASSGASAPSSSSSGGDAEPSQNPLDGFDPDGQGGKAADPSAAGEMSADSRAAADAAAKFIKAYTNYDATKTNADKFTEGLPALTPNTRGEVLKQTRAQWDRLAKDQRISEGKIDGDPSMTVPAEGDKAIVSVSVSIKEYGQTTNDQYRSSYTITMVKTNNEWLVDGVTANNT